MKLVRIHPEMHQNEGENLLNNIITIDETWIRAYEPELKRQSFEWRHEGSPRRQKLRQNRSPVNLMVILAYDVQGVSLCHFVPHGETDCTVLCCISAKSLTSRS